MTSWRTNYSRLTVEQCTDIDPVSGHQCLLSRGHDKMRGTRHRSVFAGHPFRWGTGADSVPIA